MIEITNKDPIFKGLYWVISAISKDGSRGLRCLNVEANDKGHKFIGCDGHRLHIFKTTRKTSLYSGLYITDKVTKSKIILSNAEEEVTYPNYNSTIPSPDTVIKSAKFPSPKNIASNFFNIVKTMPGNFTIDYDYFKQLTAIDKDNFKIMLSQRHNDIIIILKKKEYFGILMSIITHNEIEWSE